MSAITAHVDVKDFEKIRIRIDGLARHLTEELLDTIEEETNLIRNHIIMSIRNSTTDPTRKYKRGKKWHFASKPGSPPAIDTGNMLASIRTHSKTGKDVSEMRVGSWLNRTKGARYPAMLEEGTKFMAARPWLEPALDARWPKMQRRLSDILGQEIKRATRGAR